MVTACGGERGVALVLVLLGMTMLAAIGLGLSLTSSLARVSAANHDDALALMNAAEAGLELAARELALVAIDDVLSGKVSSPMVDGVPGPRVVAPDVTIDLQVLTHQLTCGRVVPCTDAQVQQATAERPWGVNNPRWRLFVHTALHPPALPRAAPPLYIVVWIGDDAREDDGDPAADGAGEAQEGRYIVRARAEAFGPRGGRRAIEAELARLCASEPAGDVCVPGVRVHSWRAVSALVP
jgi:hypothetical protein